MTNFTDDELYALLHDYGLFSDDISTALRTAGSPGTANAIDKFWQDCASVYAAGDWHVQSSGEHLRVSLAGNYEAVTKNRLRLLLEKACSCLREQIHNVAQSIQKILGKTPSEVSLPPTKERLGELLDLAYPHVPDAKLRNAIHDIASSFNISLHFTSPPGAFQR